METGVTDGLLAERGCLFALLARLLAAPPDGALLERLSAVLARPPDADTPLARACADLAAAAASADPAAVEREHFDLFIGLGRGELQPYASYYLTGFLYDRPLAELRETLRQLGVARAPGVAEPEDHIAFLCETFAGLLSGEFGGGEGAATAEAFFARHLRPWAARFFADLEGARAARFYRAVGALGRAAVEIEQAAAELPA